MEERVETPALPPTALGPYWRRGMKGEAGSRPPAGSLQGSGEVTRLLLAQGPQLQRSGTQAAQAPPVVVAD